MFAREHERYALECVRAAKKVAEKVKDPQTKAALLALVDAWLLLAGMADKDVAAPRARTEPDRLPTNGEIGRATKQNQAHCYTETSDAAS
jgi:hypothetical protein